MMYAALIPLQHFILSASVPPMDDDKPRRKSHAADVAIQPDAVRGDSDTPRRRAPMLLELVHLKLRMFVFLRAQS